MAAERGIDIAGGLPPATRKALAEDAPVTFDVWFERVSESRDLEPQMPIETILTELCVVEGMIIELIDGRVDGQNTQ